MNTSRPFSADTTKLAYAQAFSRTSSARHDSAQRQTTLRSLTARLHRPVKPTR